MVTRNIFSDASEADKRLAKIFWDMRGGDLVVLLWSWKYATQE